MQSPVGQERFENDVLFSMLADATNILFREKLQRRMTDDPNWLPWRDEAIFAYLPEARARLPLSVVKFTAAPAGAECDFVGSIPSRIAASLISTFLTRLFSEAQKGAFAERMGGLENVDVGAAIGDVSQHVATEMWGRWKLRLR